MEYGSDICAKDSVGQPFVYPQTRLSYAENFLNMMFSGASRRLVDVQVQVFDARVCSPL